ncbi:hypothetical protein [Acidithrix sp. C25]|uniref:hypothetical protein n=1 Tax=Acidithrix sp. C25 TaxID=1671482 RepID=UPI00191BA91D|nr:hypothetical protein [Acidithrix sp. C25]CAG4933481.1 unnamed protein product [Acidithrix sp. C25]
MEKQLSLEELIVCTRKAIAPLNHSKSTLWQYNYGWEELRFYFIAHGYDSFSIDLAGRYVDEAREKYEKGALKMWKFKLFRKTTDLLVQFHVSGTVQWKNLPKWGNQRLKEQHFIDIYDTYVQKLRIASYGEGTVELYAIVAKEFFKYLEDRDIKSLGQLTLADISLFISVISGPINQQVCARYCRGLEALPALLQRAVSPHRI